MELNPETVLRNRYQIIRLLGKGGMGAVYLAYDTTLEHQVAVKINQNPTEQATSQFLREARLLAALRHPNLPRVSDYFIEGPNQYLVMDYIPGDDLNTVVESQGAQPVEQVLRWAEQLGSALEYMHSQQPPVIHRDIKPGNLKLTSEGEVILVDFGIAKAADTSQATATGAMGYTPGYAPPEQYGSAHTGPYSDQYAFAATLYALLSGQKPVDSVQRVLGAAVLTPLGLLNARIPKHVQAAIEQAMSVKPDDRFPSVAEFVHALLDPSFQPTVKHPAQAAQSPAGTLALPQSRRLPRWLIPAGVALVAVLAIGAALIFGGGGAPAATATRPAVAQMTATQPHTATIAPAQANTQTPTAPATFTPTPEPSLTVTPSLTPTPEPTFTPTLAPLGGGGVIAFASDREDGKTFQIWTMRVSLDTAGNFVVSDLTQITSGAGNKTSPAWSPDGTKLLYVAPGGIAANGLDLGLDIFMLDLSQPGSVPVNLTERYGNDVDPAWSPDGRWIAYASDNARTDGAKTLYLMDPNVPGVRVDQLGGGQQEFSPTWSPDMKYLAYVSPVNFNNILYLRKAENNYDEPVGEFFDQAQMSARTGQVADPAFSPDGSQIAYTRNDGGIRRIYSAVFTSRGNKIARLSSASRDREPAWSPDGQWIVFTSERDGNIEVYIMTSTGLLETNLTQHPAKDQQPAWQPLPKS